MYEFRSLARILFLLLQQKVTSFVDSVHRDKPWKFIFRTTKNFKENGHSNPTLQCLPSRHYRNTLCVHWIKLQLGSPFFQLICVFASLNTECRHHIWLRDNKGCWIYLKNESSFDRKHTYPYKITSARFPFFWEKLNVRDLSSQISGFSSNSREKYHLQYNQ